MDRDDQILKLVAESVYEEEGVFFITVDADELELPLEGSQRLVVGGNATPDLEITVDGIQVSMSINRVHYNVHIPWRIVFAIEGANKAFYCRRKISEYDEEGDELEKGSKKQGEKKSKGHLRVVK